MTTVQHLSSSSPEASTPIAICTSPQPWTTSAAYLAPPRSQPLSLATDGCSRGCAASAHSAAWHCATRARAPPRCRARPARPSRARAATVSFFCSLTKTSSRPNRVRVRTDHQGRLTDAGDQPHRPAKPAWHELLTEVGLSARSCLNNEPGVDYATASVRRRQRLDRLAGRCRRDGPHVCSPCGP
jgi:hypothetical protein